MWIVTSLAGFPCMVPVARAVVRNALVGCPRREDAERIVSEFVTTAVRHSHSRGLQFQLRLEIEPGRLRIEVQDGGPFGYPPPKPIDAPAAPVHPWMTLYEEDYQRDRAAELEEYSLGLAIINAACDKWGHSAYPGYEIWWAKLAWSDPGAAAPVELSNRTADSGIRGNA